MKTRSQALLDEAAHHLEFAAIALRRASAEHEDPEPGIEADSYRCDRMALIARERAKPSS